ncbi:helix-turn-helix domain-containing protein [Rhodobacteraceae bacterium 2376]|uniref:Helix-turn-helix domain-containing protein n=1 Tax=Rhabdonatronobacter sediminivivens TaxID=2743469 RepID=A0A7Z0HX27_9RHOB|nr:helix-turn-helix transcriptional regulator [Rhabdonatronobacter sediminivivens]NYS23883.1 helix-turn-helix domain-containing protein [Rhabdonatronobacter sediminivivens]
MPRTALTGTRIRARRTARGMRQADLARTVGVSPSYLNLIEHNRRNVGADLLGELAKALGVAPDSLLEGSEGEVMEAVRAAAAGLTHRANSADKGPLGTLTPPELERIEEFLGRFPGWAAVLAATHARVDELERVVEQLSDRMAHDPYLPAALHEIVSAVTSVQSTAAILADGEEIDPDWQRKFLANLLADSSRLADGAEALVNYLDASGAGETGLAAPQEEVEAWLAARNYHPAELEADCASDLRALVADQVELSSDAARALALKWLRRFQADARALPLDPFLAAVAELGLAPDRLALRFDAPLAQVLRRIACLPQGAGVPDVGLVLCDGSGTLTFRRPVDGFALPRFGGACPVWPLFQALLRPAQPLCVPVQTGGRIGRRFTAYACADTRGTARFDAPPVVEATMLLVPDSLPTGDAPTARPRRVGPSCRICAERDCPARREPSILAGGALAEGAMGTGGALASAEGGF